MYKADNTIKKPIFSVKSQIHTVVVDTSLFTNDLLEYLAIHIKHLYQLTLCGSVSRSTQSIIAALTAYSKQPRRNALALKCIRFESYLSYSNEIIQQTRSDENNNLMLDLIGFNLDYLITDIQNVFEGRITGLSKTSLEVTTTNNVMPKTVYLQRKSKWTPDNLFNLRDSNQYVNKNARNRRLKSVHTCVLTIKADSIHYVRLYCHSQDNRHLFSLIINLRA
ncbi:4-hydroxyphenylpyruvate dioxygenase [Mucor velutinosus]|uniref:4-hydroxyphenylpyruvate dioxygenase n=1 Tax=Mucor velutinosus TaxID=708070 RepID=A0AAN7HWV4_9FUNG|nr:4-hydroxyphenylpyruvate dioxygenase [Mucor velutinosus]